MGKVYYATHDYEIIPCHFVSKSRNGKPIYKANSKRDGRLFMEVYKTKSEARQKVAAYERYMSEPDTF